MGRLNLRALQVRHNTTNILETQQLSQFPAWYQTVGLNAPSQPLVRTQPVRHQAKKCKSRRRKANKMYMPQNIKYAEDELRHTFFQQHPWELARPRVLVERDGKDGQRSDWAEVGQSNRQLDGESVVQHQMWLRQNTPGASQLDAYNMARQKFYDLRLQQDVERRVAQEEASFTGAYFGPTASQVSQHLENQAFEGWKKWAQEEARKAELARQSSFTTTEDDAEDDASQSQNNGISQSLDAIEEAEASASDALRPS